MKPFLFVSIPVVMLSALLTLGRADAPPSIPVQGFLMDASGTPLDGNFDAVLFSIYDAQTGGQALWSQNVPLTVEQGIFSAYLDPVDLTLFRDHGQLWLGIQVGDDEEMERFLIGSTPFAAYAEYTSSSYSIELSGEFEVQAGLTDCSTGCTEVSDLGEWKFCALVGFESRIYDNTGTTYSDVNNCKVYMESGVWWLSAHYYADGSPSPVGYTHCTARCFN